MALYQSMRPKNLDEFSGNEATVRGLKGVLRRPVKDRPHTFLFSGPTGCGKTTLARILAKEFGCREDGMCVIELNAANTRGIDTVRDITRNVGTLPLYGTAKVYILDESHQLTKAAQEGLLKVIEDCPTHVYFIFCTTAPENLILTIRNRCAKYEVGRLGRKLIIGLLKDACEKTDIDKSSAMLKDVAYASEGCPRTALVLLEKIADIEDEDEALELLVEGTEDDANIYDLCKLLIMDPAIRQKRWKEIIKLFSVLDNDSETVRRSILGFLLRKLVQCSDETVAVDISNLMEIFSTSTFYGGKSQLGVLIVKACFNG